MAEFTEYFKTINGANGKVILEHNLWGKQICRCNDIQVINDDNRIGLRLKHQEVYIHKRDIILCKKYNKMFVIADKNMQITIIVNSL